MGYDTRLLFGPLVEPSALAGWMPTTFRETGEVVAYDDLVARLPSAVIGVGVGQRSILVMDPNRRLPGGFIERWREDGGETARIVSLDLDERRDDYTLELHSVRPPRSRVWHQRRAQSQAGPRAPEEKGFRFPTSIETKVLFDFVARLGFTDPILDLSFAVYAPSRARVTARASLEYAFGPTFLRLLVVRLPEDVVIDAIERHVDLKYKEQLKLKHLVGGCLSPTTIAVAKCGDYTALFDASGSLVFDLRWLAGPLPSPVVALWGHIEQMASARSSAFAALDEPAVFGFALYEDGAMTRRVTFSAGRVVETVKKLPKPLLCRFGKPLANEAELTREKAHMTLREVMAFLDHFGFAGKALSCGAYSMYQMIPR